MLKLLLEKKNKQFLSDFSIDENVTHIDKSLIDKEKKTINIPISIDSNTLGEVLSVEVENNLITNIKLNIDSKEINFMYLIKEKSKYLSKSHKDNIYSLDSSYKFYLSKNEMTRNFFVLAIKVIDNKYVDKIMFYMAGVVLNRVKDIFCDGYI